MKAWNDYRPELMGLLVGILSLIAWFLLITAMDSKVIPSTLDDLFDSFTVLVGALVGALAAFFLHDTGEKRKQKEREARAINSTLFVLHRQIEAFERYRYKTLEPFRKDTFRMINVPIDRLPDLSGLKIDFGSLDYLLKQPGAPAILFELSIYQFRYDSAVSSVDLRNKYHEKRLQPVMIRDKIKEGRYNTADLEKKLGPQIYPQMVSFTEDIYFMVDTSIKDAYILINKLCDLGNELFPDKTFLSVDTLEQDRKTKIRTNS